MYYEDDRACVHFNKAFDHFSFDGHERNGLLAGTQLKQV